MTTAATTISTGAPSVANPADDHVHWTTFPAIATAVDATDHRATHSLVMGLFPPDLDTPTGQERSRGRSVADILFRVDVVGDQRHVLVQSRVAPLHQALPDSARTMTFTPDTFTLPAGAFVRFRVTVNPITRNGRSRTERVLDADASAAWLLARLTPALRDVDIACHARDLHVQAGRPRHLADTLTLDTFDGAATVNDPAALDTLRLTGLGRRKAYGAGLLTVQRIG